MEAAAVAASTDPAYMQSFWQDGLFWHLLTYCAGVGGSLLIIGSAAGVVAMGLEKINFAWYFKKITLLAFVGYLSGILVILLEHLLIGLCPERSDVKKGAEDFPLRPFHLQAVIHSRAADCRPAVFRAERSPQGTANTSSARRCG